MGSNQRGFAFILVLMLLALGSLLIIPSLQLAFTALKAKQINTSILNEQYARDGAVEYALWQLRYGSLSSTLSEASPTASYQLTLNGITSEVTIKMRAEPGTGGISLASGDKIRPTKTVSPATSSPGVPTTYTYTITLEQVSNDSSQGLSNVFDLLPPGFSYVAGSTSWDQQEWSIAPFDPVITTDGSNILLEWSFSPNIFFTEREKKTLTFQATAAKGTGGYCNEVILKPNDTVSGPQAQIVVGNPVPPNCKAGKIQVAKTSTPPVISPNVPTTVTYTISLINNDAAVRRVERIRDVLPPGFTYVNSSSSGLTTNDPTQTLRPDGRWLLEWHGTFAFAGGTTTTLAFQALTTQSQSGSYYNEVFLDLEEISLPKVLEGIISEDDYFETYSWHTAPVTVPVYDVRATVEGTTGYGNASVTSSDVTLNSWYIESK